MMDGVEQEVKGGSPMSIKLYWLDFKIIMHVLKMRGSVLLVKKWGSAYQSNTTSH